MKLEQRRSAWYTVAAGAVITALGVGMYAAGQAWALVLPFGGLAAAILGLVWAGIATRCPHCGRGLPLLSRSRTSCPYCHRDL
ncbi:MAG: hypothetical protein LUH36_06255 [Oscillospiraceae bacterium]|nr:hypothetical protein [Oscillospiraceae bacterium]